MRLEIRNLCKSFSGKEILKSICMTVESGQTMGFLGRNGAGKTTAMRCIMGVFYQDSGEILLDGKVFRRRDAKVGYLPEERGMYAKISLLDQIAYFGRLKGMTPQAAKKAALYWIERLDLMDYKNKKLMTLSKGNQQKIQLTQALVDDPDILILDEPFSGLDPLNAEVLKQIIREYIAKNRIVIFSSHQMSYVEQFCDDVTMIQDGEVLISGPLKDIRKAMSAGRYILSANETETATKSVMLEDATIVDSYKPGLELARIYEGLSQKLPRSKPSYLEKKDMIEIFLPSKQDKKDFFACLSNMEADVERFDIAEAGLEQIFVELAKFPEKAKLIRRELGETGALEQEAAHQAAESQTAADQAAERKDTEQKDAERKEA